jgi:hypothetical protein
MIQIFCHNFDPSEHTFHAIPPALSYQLSKLQENVSGGKRFRQMLQQNVSLHGRAAWPN